MEFEKAHTTIANGKQTFQLLKKSSGRLDRDAATDKAEDQAKSEINPVVKSIGTIVNTWLARFNLTLEDQIRLLLSSARYSRLYLFCC